MTASNGVRGLLGALASLAVWILVFAVLCWPWLRVAAASIPDARAVEAGPQDARLIIWVLAWVSHALATNPAGIYDANIFHPAPHQLTGTEHFASTQLTFAPLWALTGNAVLATNLCVFLSYPLAAFAMERLLLALGCRRATAWVAGLGFALGPLRVPASLQSLQYAALWLPAAMLALLRLRQTPRVGRAAWLSAALVGGLFSSYYMAGFLGVVVVAWGALLLAGAGPGRSRFVLLAGAACTLPVGLLVLFSLPYAARWDAYAWLEDTSRFMRAIAPTLVDARFVLWFGVVPLVLAGAGFAAFAGRLRLPRRLALSGILFVAIGIGLIAVLSWWIPNDLLPFGVAGLFDVVTRVLRISWRLVVVVGLGTTFLAAAALETLRPHRLPALTAVVAAVALFATRGVELARTPVEEVRAVSRWAPVYAAVADTIARLGPGPLLELPARSAPEPVPKEIAERLPRRGRLVTLPGRDTYVIPIVAESMIASTRHWLPLVRGYTGYQPSHHRLLNTLINRLPEDQALRDLLDMSRARWLLLHPRDQWRDTNEWETLLRVPFLRPALMRDGFVLLEVERTPEHPDWFAALARGPSRDRTILGTPLAPLAPDDAVAILEATSLPETVAANAPVPINLEVSNGGNAAWPVLALTGLGPAPVVRLLATFRLLPDGDPDGAPQELPLPRDVSPGEEVRVGGFLKAPSTPGDYELVIAADQRDGTPFRHGSTLRARVTVTPAPP